MKAGRETIRSLVAVHVLGWEYIKDGLYRDHKGNQIVFNPEKDINDAWVVVEKYPDGVEILKCPDCYICYIHIFDDFRAEAETAPLAICLAALKAVGVEVDGLG